MSTGVSVSTFRPKHGRTTRSRDLWPALGSFGDTDRIAEAAGVTAVGDTTETTVRVAKGRVVARSEERGAGYAAAVMYEVPSREDAGQVIITRETVIDNVNPTIVPRRPTSEKPR